jgi:ABC-type nitrate/sulfonate/bicarbonate transport system substrate-binding protein
MFLTSNTNTVARSALVLLLLLVAPISTAAQGLSKVSVTLNFAADGGAAGFYHALERGYFRELGLDVAIEPSKGSADAITRTASRTSDIGIGDISTLVEFTSHRPEIAPKAVFILHNRSPQAVIALKSSGVTKLVYTGVSSARVQQTRLRACFGRSRTSPGSTSAGSRFVSSVRNCGTPCC